MSSGHFTTLDPENEFMATDTFTFPPPPLSFVLFLYLRRLLDFFGDDGHEVRGIFQQFANPQT